MKTIVLSLFLTLLILPAIAATDISGTWNIAVREEGARNFSLPMTDGRLVIDAGGTQARFNQIIFSGQTSADGLHLTCTLRGRACGALVLRLAGNRLVGAGTIDDRDGFARAVTVTGVRPTPRRAPRHFDFVPTRFSSVYSGAVPPVLHLQPGDTVSTSTLDSRGYDKEGRQRAPRGNPLTGPFYIDGAMPGDTLVVHLLKVRTNRDSAFQYNLVFSTALEAGYMRQTAQLTRGFSDWKIDAAAGIATLRNATGKMAGYSVKLSPMLGCIGVAPPNDQVLTAGHLGPFGGNLDSPHVGEGATLYIPVFQPGALLFVGDGHAQQGDGELTGQGLETSLDISFRVDLIQGKALGQPRLENADSVIVMGTGATLDAAMRSATTQMSRWLTNTYGLTPHEIAPLLGTAMHFDISEVVDPEYSVVARISRAALAKIGK